jgi:hypothetical protein
MQLVPHQTKQIDGIGFNISKSFENGYITKTIKVNDDNIEKYFYERVQALTLNQFEIYFKNAGLKIDSIFGDYDLNSFVPTDSDRLIIITKSNAITWRSSYAGSSTYRMDGCIAPCFWWF